MTRPVEIYILLSPAVNKYPPARSASMLSGPSGPIRVGVATDKCDRAFLLPASCPGYSPYPLADLLVVSLRALIALHRAISIPADNSTAQTSFASSMLSSL